MLYTEIVYLRIPERKHKKKRIKIAASGMHGIRKNGKIHEIINKNPNDVSMYWRRASDENGSFTSTKIYFKS
jgi:ribosomal protein L28